MSPIQAILIAPRCIFPFFLMILFSFFQLGRFYIYNYRYFFISLIIVYAVFGFLINPSVILPIFYFLVFSFIFLFKGLDIKARLIIILVFSILAILFFSIDPYYNSILFHPDSSVLREGIHHRTNIYSLQGNIFSGIKNFKFSDLLTIKLENSFALDITFKIVQISVIVGLFLLLVLILINKYKKIKDISNNQKFSIFLNTGKLNRLLKQDVSLFMFVAVFITIYKITALVLMGADIGSRWDIITLKRYTLQNSVKLDGVFVFIVFFYLVYLDVNTMILAGKVIFPQFLNHYFENTNKKKISQFINGYFIFLPLGIFMVLFLMKPYFIHPFYIKKIENLKVSEDDRKLIKWINLNHPNHNSKIALQSILFIAELADYINPVGASFYYQIKSVRNDFCLTNLDFCFEYPIDFYRKNITIWNQNKIIENKLLYWIINKEFLDQTPAIKIAIGSGKLTEVKCFGDSCLFKVVFKQNQKL